MAERAITGVAIWLVAVLGAGMVLVGPITPWLVPVEVVGLTTCLVATTALLLWLFRR
jgi:hypothetical protein